ncbi:HEAT repeat domain-containing protein [Treponema parvum]|uniref:HEAT repeat domain-containing protein n=1 Tax=Treponema parvum TaxID=138851 RepID=A0A975F3C9_9SPIR|nr:HEAT repeat domain-containing protein [Treponema parvum]QTQ13657.1 HEAT repeat domain-containing protein [Treponema parvum]
MLNKRIIAAASALLSVSFAFSQDSGISAVKDPREASSDTAVSENAASSGAESADQGAASSDAPANAAPPAGTSSGSAALSPDTSDSENSVSGGPSKIPAKKRPRKPDGEKVKIAQQKDVGKDAVNDKRDTIKYGIETDIVKLVEELSSNDDPRFVDDLYDLFYTTKSDRIRIAILDYFAGLEDPCLEDYAVDILNDPYDENSDLVSSVFKYAAAVKSKAAIPAVMAVLENDNETYFNNALTTIGAIGGNEEAAVLVQYLEREDLSVAQRQTLMKVLGSIRAVETWQTLSDIVENEDENVFVRCYAAESIGAMQKEESLPILKELFEDRDPNLRIYALKGLSNYKKDKVKDVFLEALRDPYYKVRLEAISGIEKLDITEASPSLIYRAKNDPEAAVKKASYPVIAKLETSEGDEFLTELLADKKTGDGTKALASDALMKHKKSVAKEILDLAQTAVKDKTRKQLRYSLGKQFVKYAAEENLRPQFAEICRLYLESDDVLTRGIGLDLYAIGRYSGSDEIVRSIAESEKKSAVKTKARKILKLED